MVHLRIVCRGDLIKKVLDLLCASPSAINVVHLPGASHKPQGDLIMCDLAREDASVIISDLKELGVHHGGSIAVEHVDTQISDAAVAAEHAAAGLPSDAVLWEEVEARTSESTELSFSFIVFMVAAMQIAAVGIALDQPILIVGAMVVGPEFGPLAAICVGIVERRAELVRRSVVALALGFPIGGVLALLSSLVFIAMDVFPDDLVQADHPLTRFISHPDFLSFFVAVVAATAGMLSLTASKSGALIGVLISVTTIPAASNVAVATAYGDFSDAGGAAAQLGINLTGIVVAGVVTLWVQRRYYVARRRKHLADPARGAAGLPLGRSTSGSIEIPGWEELQHKQRSGTRPE
jgi:uncharacterized hydrophobic protein (TIGR00271 family)